MPTGRLLPGYGVIIETESAGRLLPGYAVVIQTSSSAQTVAVGQVTETDLAQAITWAPKNRLVNQASEADSAQAITARKTLAIGQASETDSAQAISALKRIALGQASETDLAQAVVALKSLVLGQASETDLAQAITESGTLTGTVNQVEETDSAQAIAWSPKHRLVAQVAEVDVAQLITILKSKAIGQALETDVANAITWSLRRLVNQVEEIDSADAITPVGGGAAPARDLGGGARRIRRLTRDYLHLTWKRYEQAQEQIAEEIKQATEEVRGERLPDGDERTIEQAVRVAADRVRAAHAERLRALARALPAPRPHETSEIRARLEFVPLQAVAAMRNDHNLREEVRRQAWIELQRRNDDIIIATVLLM